MINYAIFRKDLEEKGWLPPLLKGYPKWLTSKEKFRFASLETETPEGYNMVIWLPNEDFIDLANSIDFDFIKEVK